MGYKQMRIGQLIAPFGPGGIYTDRRGVPHVVAGLDYWFMRWNQGLSRMEPCSNREEFVRYEPRLSTLLRVNRFCLPPDYRHVFRGEAPPPNAGLHIPALRFPRWYRHTKSGKMHRFNLHTSLTPRPADGGRWQPVRFIAVCSAGHLCEFPWKQWIGCQCLDDGDLYLTDRGGSELSSIRVECRSCPAGSSGRQGRSLSGTTVIPDGLSGHQSAFQSAGITCPGDQPWLGEGATEANCQQSLIGALINQTNIYFPRTLSAITLPDLQPADDAITSAIREIEKEQGTLGAARTIWKMGMQRQAAAMIRQALADRAVNMDLDRVLEALTAMFEGRRASAPNTAAPRDPESELLTFRRAEFNILRNEVNDPDRVPNLRVIPAGIAAELSAWFARVHLVERLRETRVFLGFDRLEPATSPLLGMPDTAMRQLFRAQPSAEEQWLPAVEVFGEGIYLELLEEPLTAWQQSNADWLKERLDDAFVNRLSGVSQSLPPLGPASWLWASRFLLIHSLAHVLINELVFECGYSTASLRERLYVSSDAAAPMAGLLIYTAAGDSEGTLGGLVRLGRAERLGLVMNRALDRASWCSADPVCSEHLGGQGSRLANLAACHACILLPETSCETINQGLDRSMVVGTPEARERGFLSPLLDAAFVL
jgi:Domain of unknown function (DUF1998)